MKRIMSHEPNADLLSPDDVDSDVVAFGEALLERRAERIAHNILLRPDIQDALRQLLATKLYASEEEVIARPLGSRRPCSQSCTVRILTFVKPAQAACDVLSCTRIACGAHPHLQFDTPV